MSDNTPAGVQPSLASLVGGLIEDTQQLIRQEAALARRELQEEWTKTKVGATLFSGAVVLFAVVGGVLFYKARTKLEQVHVVPPQTAESLRQDVQAVTSVVTAPQPTN